MEERHAQGRQPDELATGRIPGRLGKRTDKALEPPWLCVVAPAIVRTPPVGVVRGRATPRSAIADATRAVSGVHPRRIGVGNQVAVNVAIGIESLRALRITWPSVVAGE